MTTNEAEQKSRRKSGLRGRRRNGEGTIHQRADGRWMAQLRCGFREDGRSRIVTVYGDTERDALKELRKVRSRLDDGKEPTTPRQTLASFADGFLTGAEQRLKPSTVGFYRDNLTRYIAPALGRKPIAAVCRQDVVRLVRALRQQGLSLATVRGIKATLSAILSEAAEMGLRSENPALAMKKHLSRGGEPAPQPDPLTRDEAERLLTTARAHFPRWYGFVACGLMAGLRIGELLALDWGDIDWRARTIVVRRNIVRGAVTTPKNHQQRSVDMSRPLVAALRWHRRQMRAEFADHGLQLPAPIFVSREATRLDDSNTRKVFGRVCAKAELSQRSPHDMRHTFASLLLSGGRSIAYVARQLGHKNAQVTLTVYTHWLPSTDSHSGLSFSSRREMTVSMTVKREQPERIEGEEPPLL